MKNHRTYTLLFAFLLFPAVAAAGPIKVKITDVRAKVKRNADGQSWVSVDGRTTNAPDGTTIVAEMGFQGHQGIQAYVDIKANRFNLAFGPSEKKLLPGTYIVKVEVDPRVQKLAVADQLKDSGEIKGSTTFQVGSPSEARNEKLKIRKKYEDLLEGLYALYTGLAQWGSSIATQSAIAKIRHRGKVPKRTSAKILKEWNKFSAILERDLPTIRFDHKQFTEYFVAGYFPGADRDVAEIITTLERWHAGLTGVIYANLGLKPPANLKSKSGFSPGEMKDKLVPLAARVYKDLKVEPLSWALAETGIPEKSKDINGDWFRSTVSKFTIKKPGQAWFFDVGATNPTMRIRMRYRGEDLTKRIVAGVELRDYSMAENPTDLARLDERMTRSRYPGFEHISTKKINAPDPTMPKGRRPGQEMRFTIKAGDFTFFVIQYSLFCRWHKRTYNMMSFADEGIKGDWIPVFEKINKSFRVLDDPKFKKEQELQKELMGDGEEDEKEPRKSKRKKS